MIREIIEARAREAAAEVWSRFKTCWPELVGDYRQDSNPPAIERIIQSAIITILTDPQIGFKEALETLNDVCRAYHDKNSEFAEAKLAELKELKP